ncbi:hypothetical protein ACIPPM_21945 [Streptomyces sp. NPDC090119]|uniref:hypothetical protein n=1 Tax=Streptomyces sp. NPDC090119 TaxID=3365951 RepID=UPI00382C6C22
MSAGRARGSDRFTTAGQDTTLTQRAAATQLVREHARDQADEQHLLDVLGLTAPSSKDS